MKTTTREKFETRMRASWRTVLVSLLRLTRRVEGRLAARVRRLPAA